MSRRVSRPEHTQTYYLNNEKYRGVRSRGRSVGRQGDEGAKRAPVGDTSLQLDVLIQ